LVGRVGVEPTFAASEAAVLPVRRPAKSGRYRWTRTITTPLLRRRRLPIAPCTDGAPRWNRTSTVQGLSLLPLPDWATGAQNGAHPETRTQKKAGLSRSCLPIAPDEHGAARQICTGVRRVQADYPAAERERPRNGRSGASCTPILRVGAEEIAVILRSCGTRREI